MRTRRYDLLISLCLCAPSLPFSSGQPALLGCCLPCFGFASVDGVRPLARGVWVETVLDLQLLPRTIRKPKCWVRDARSG